MALQGGIKAQGNSPQKQKLHPHRKHPLRIRQPAALPSRKREVFESLGQLFEQFTVLLQLPCLDHRRWEAIEAEEGCGDQRTREHETDDHRRPRLIAANYHEATI